MAKRWMRAAVNEVKNYLMPSSYSITVVQHCLEPETGEQEELTEWQLQIITDPSKLSGPNFKLARCKLDEKPVSWWTVEEKHDTVTDGVKPCTGGLEIGRVKKSELEVFRRVVREAAQVISGDADCDRKWIAVLLPVMVSHKWVESERGSVLEERLAEELEDAGREMIYVTPRGVGPHHLHIKGLTPPRVSFHWKAIIAIYRWGKLTL